MAAIVLRTFQFHVWVDNQEVAQFSEVSGFDVTYDPIEYRGGDSQSLTTQKFPGLAKYGNVTLKRGILIDTGDNSDGTASNVETNKFFEWINQSATGQYKKSTVRIDLCDPATGSLDTPVASWELTNAWPTKYTGPDLKAQTAEIAMETLELAHEGCARIEAGNNAPVEA